MTQEGRSSQGNGHLVLVKLLQSNIDRILEDDRAHSDLLVAVVCVPKVVWAENTTN